MTYRIFIILNLLFICKTTFVKAQEKFWQEVRGPYRGVVSTMILTSKATLLAGINEAGANKVYRSSDNGNTWNPVLSVNGTVLSFGIDSTQGRIYIGVDPPLNSDPSMYYSSDDGITWNVLQAPNTYILSIVVTSPGNIFLGTYNGIYKSINSGQNWNLIHNASDNNLIDALEFTPSGNLLIGTFLGGVYTSPDSGLSWTSIGLEGKRWTYPIKYSKTGSIYVGSNNGLLVSKDYGLTWNNIDSLSDGGVHSFDFDKNGNLYVGLAGWTYYTLNPSLGMCFSTDNGENWDRIGLKKYSISSVIIGTDGTIFVGSDGGIHRSIDKGNNWQSIGIDKIGTYALTEQSNNTIYAGDDMEGGIYKTSDFGENWERVAWGLTNGQIQDLAVNSENHVFASAIGTKEGVYRSTDSGNSWELQFSDEPISQFFFNSEGYGFAASLTDLYGFGGLFRSTDNGNTWLRIVKSNFDIFTVSCDSPYVFLGTSNGMYRSTDLGETWDQPNSGLTSNNITTLVVDTNQNKASFGWIFAGTKDAGIFRSINNGSNWEAMNEGIKGKNVRKIVLDKYGDLVAITESGAFQTNLDSNKWNPLPWTFPRNPITLLITNDRRILIAPYEMSLELSKMIVTDVIDKYDTPNKKLNISQNYPNPFNPITTIKYTIPKETFVTLTIYDVLGRKITTLVNEEKHSGTYKVTWNAQNVPSGIYFYKIIAGEYSKTKKMILLK